MNRKNPEEDVHVEPYLVSDYSSNKISQIQNWIYVISLAIIALSVMVFISYNIYTASKFKSDAYSTWRQFKDVLSNMKNKATSLFPSF